MTEQKRKWKKVTPIPPEYNGHSYLWYCTKCGEPIVHFGDKEPKRKCPKCGNGEVAE